MDSHAGGLNGFRLYHPAWQRVAAATSQFETAVHEAERVARKEAHYVPDQFAETVCAGLKTVVESLWETIGDEVAEDADTKAQIGAYAQQQFLPYLLLAAATRRMYTKPRGYAGDYLTIERIYENRPGGAGHIGPLIDRSILGSPPCQAVRNRRGLLVEEIERTVKAKNGGRAKIMSLACGPSREVFDVVSAIDTSCLQATLLDFDFQALASVAKKRDRLGLQKSIRLLNENLLYLALGRTEAPARDQDLIYSIGLIDYFEDALVIKLLNLIHQMLLPGGRVILGNFHPRNRMKAFMDHVVEWRLIHRTESQMNELFARSAFGRTCTTIRFEQEGINLFAECVKD